MQFNRLVVDQAEKESTKQRVKVFTLLHKYNTTHLTLRARYCKALARRCLTLYNTCG